MDLSTITDCSGGGGGSISADGGVVAVSDDLAVEQTSLVGWSLQNTNAGLSTVYIRFGDEATSTPYIAVNLAENETVTQIFDTAIPSADGFFVTVEAGSVDGVLYVS